MSKEILLKLSERCRDAKHADYPLSDEIAIAVGWKRTEIPPYTNYDVTEIIWTPPEGVTARRSPAHPPYVTGNVSEAMMLIPEGWRVEDMGENQENGDGDYTGVWRVSLRLPKNAYVYGNGGTLALAICAAALCARAKMLDSEQIPVIPLP